MTALILILVSAAVHAVVNVLTKRGVDKYAMRVLTGVFSALMVTPALVFLPLPQGQAIDFLIATTVVHALYEWLLVRSYESTAFSAVYPVARGTGPLFTALGVIFVLGQHPPALELIGIALVCSGVIAMGLSHRATEGAAAGLAFALATGVTIGAYTLIDASGVRATPNPYTYVAWFFVVHGCSVLFVAPAIRGKSVLIAAHKDWRTGVLLGALSITTYGAAMLAFRYGATARLAALRETSVLFGTALAVVFLGEKMTTRRWLAALVIAGGAIALQTG